MSTLTVPGFEFAGIASGIKKNGKSDIGLVVMPAGGQFSAVYTQNQIVAAPVVVSRAAAEEPSLYAVIVNSGNANAATGDLGYKNACEMVTQVSEKLGVNARQVQVCSTGVIGQQLPMPKIKYGIDKAFEVKSEDGLRLFAEAIRTTDLYPKVVSKTWQTKDAAYQVVGVAKGAGMIGPNMATMLAFVFTNAPVDKKHLAEIWPGICQKTFNSMVVDGDTSTNDTAMILSSGTPDSSMNSATLEAFQNEVLNVCDELAHLIVSDGEGATKAVRVVVCEAISTDDADRIARTVASSPLVKTALHGEDPNWGRIIAAVGRSGVLIEPKSLSLSIGDSTIYANENWQGHDQERRAHEVMKAARYTMTITLGLGTKQAAVLMSDLSAEYVKINSDYRS